MSSPFEKKLLDYSRCYLTDAELEILMDGTADSRYGKVKRLIAQGKLIHIRRGLYCLARVGNREKPHPFELAQYIYGPSYISLESALSFHKLIPEAVYTVTSATTKRSKEFATPLGVFNYLHLPLENFYTEVELVKENGYQFLIARPWKAICDYIYCYKKNWDSLGPLLSSLRINREDFSSLSTEECELLDEYYHHRRISRFLKAIRREV